MLEKVIEQWKRQKMLSMDLSGKQDWGAIERTATILECYRMHGVGRKWQSFFFFGRIRGTGRNLLFSGDF